MPSLARASFQRKMAALAAGSPVDGAAPPMPTEGPAAGEYTQLLIALGNDLNQLRNIQATDRKVEAKRRMIEIYRAWAEGAADADAGTQDEVVATMLVWAIDIADWALTLKLGAYVVRAGIALPERYRRSPAALLAENVAEARIKGTAQVPLTVLQDVARITAGTDMHDQVRAKIEKAQGLALRDSVDAFDPEAETAIAGGRAALLAAAHAHFTEALRLDDGCGVKTLIRDIEREQKKLQENAP